MKAMKGYYSLIQFCPNPSRSEAVNVGVALVCPEAGFVAAHISEDNARAKRFFGRDGLQLVGLSSAKEALRDRLDVESHQLKDLDGFKQFIATRANVLQLTEPRPVKVFNPPADLDQLYWELVEPERKTHRSGSPIPELDTFFQGLVAQGRASLNKKVIVPVIQKSIISPYVYQNGVTNLVKPYRFSERERESMETAGTLALEGDLLRRHAEDTKLVVVTAFESPEAETLLRPRMEALFHEYQVETVGSNRLSEFMRQVERDAH